MTEAEIQSDAAASQGMPRTACTQHTGKVGSPPQKPSEVEPRPAITLTVDF